MSTPITYVEISELVTYAEQNFEQLKFLVHQPLCYESTGDAASDARKERELEFAPNRCADAIAASIQHVAKCCGMNPKRLRITVPNPKTSDEQTVADSQKRVIELHKEFYEFLKEHGIYTCYMRYDKHGVSPRPPQKFRRTKLDIVFDNKDWDEY